MASESAFSGDEPRTRIILSSFMTLPRFNFTIAEFDTEHAGKADGLSATQDVETLPLFAYRAAALDVQTVCLILTWSAFRSAKGPLSFASHCLKMSFVVSSIFSFLIIMLWPTASRTFALPAQISLELTKSAHNVVILM